MSVVIIQLFRRILGAAFQICDLRYSKDYVMTFWRLFHVIYLNFSCLSGPIYKGSEQKSFSIIVGCSFNISLVFSLKKYPLNSMCCFSIEIYSIKKLQCSGGNFIILFLFQFLLMELKVEFWEFVLNNDWDYFNTDEFLHFNTLIFDGSRSKMWIPESFPEQSSEDTHPELWHASAQQPFSPTGLRHLPPATLHMQNNPETRKRPSLHKLVTSQFPSEKHRSTSQCLFAATFRKSGVQFPALEREQGSGPIQRDPVNHDVNRAPGPVWRYLRIGRALYSVRCWLLT